MTQFSEPFSFSDDAKTIAAFMAQTLRPLGFKKRRNGFNRRLENGFIHQLSIFSVGAYSIDHGEFYVHAGCYIPEAELFRRNVIDPEWISDALCTIRGQFPKSYLSLREVAANPGLITPHLNDAIEALGTFDHYDNVLGGTAAPGQPFATEPLYFETPQPVVKACILLSRADREGATVTLQRYLADLNAEESPHFDHIDVVSKWALEMGLQLSDIS